MPVGNVPPFAGSSAKGRVGVLFFDWDVARLVVIVADRRSNCDTLKDSVPTEVEAVAERDAFGVLRDRGEVFALPEPEGLELDVDTVHELTVAVCTLDSVGDGVSIEAETSENVKESDRAGVDDCETLVALVESVCENRIPFTDRTTDGHAGICNTVI